MSALLVMPTLVFSLHILFHHHDEAENHYHNETTFCGHDISLCECSDFVFTFFTPHLLKISYKLSNFIFKKIDINSIKDIYLNLFLGQKKGRSPPPKML